MKGYVVFENPDPWTSTLLAAPFDPASLALTAQAEAPLPFQNARGVAVRLQAKTRLDPSACTVIQSIAEPPDCPAD